MISKKYGCLNKRRLSLPRLLGIVAVTLALSSCGGSSSAPDDGGIIGTGIQLNGTVPTSRQFAESTIGIKAASGEQTTGAIASNGRFSVDAVAGEGPYLLKVNLGNGNAYYGVAHALSMTSVTQNVHAYSDLAIRNWFATQGLDIDTLFASAGAVTGLPAAAQIGAINDSILALVRESLALYGLSGTDLSTVSFDANDQGVDSFLDRNPVLINNGNITIIIGDPSNDSQSVISDALPVNTDLVAVDTIPPSAPTGLRVLPSASDEIVLAWDAATDNIGVVTYEVLRDGVAVATNAFPTLIDSPLASGVNFIYTIVAIDAAGNRSQESAAGSSMTLAAPDTIAPPAPTALNLAPGSDNIRVSWSQSGIVDVASFTVLSGQGSTMLDRVGRVSTTSFTDTGLNGGIEYCYQILANDASENESAPSAIACATIGGSSVTITPPVVTPPTNGGTTNGLLAVNVANLACNTEIVDFDIDTAVTLDQSCYSVTRDLVISQQGQLTVSAGTVLKFANGTGIEVRAGGSLTANGTATLPVVFSALSPTDGSWDGIEFDRSNSSANQLNNTVIEYGGASNQAGLTTTGRSTAPVRISLNNVLIRNSAGDGIELSPDALIDNMTGLIITQNARTGSSSAEMAALFGTDSQLTGNTIDGLSISNVAVSTTTVWAQTQVPYLIDQLVVNAPLSVPAGAVVIAESNGDLDIRTGGSLSAVGTASAPIRFTGQEATPGYWRGIEFDRTNSTNNRLEHVTIEYGGSSATARGAVSVQGFASAPARVAFQDVTLRFGLGAGVRITDNVTVSAFENVTSTSNGFSGAIAFRSIGSIGTGSDFQGNTQDNLRILSPTLTTDVAMRALNVPYVFSNMVVNAGLTLAPGVTMLADSGAELSVRSGGSFNAVGTAAMPITIAGSSSLPGFWDGLKIDRTDSVLNVLQFVALSDGGGGSSTNGANIEVTCFSSAPSRLSVSDSTISNSVLWGIYRNSADCGLDVAASVTFAGNAMGDINPL